MARVPFGIEKGLRIWGENSDSATVSVLFGSGAPGGDVGDQDDAGVGSLYMRTSNGALYKKIADANSTADWTEFTAADFTMLSWRSDKTVVATNDTAPSNGTVIDLVATPFGDDDGTKIIAADFIVGNLILFDVDGTPKLMKVSVVAGDSITVTDVGVDALADNDAFIVRNFLPDSGNAQEKSVLLFYDGSAIIKLSDFNWALADGITLNGYTESQGPTTGTDTLQVAIEKNGGDVTDLVSLTGVARGAVTLGTFTGTTIPDSQTIKAALQALETALEEIDVNVNDLITLSGVAENATHLGTFTGTTIPDSSTVKAALQSLETSLEEIDANVNDLITLSGVAENATTLGTFTGTTIPDSSTVKAALQSLETAVEARTQQTAVTSATTLDSVLVDNIKAVKWFVQIFEDATPANVKAMEVFAAHNGTGAADATLSDNTQSAILKLGSVFNTTLSVDLNGTGGSQVMRLRIASSSAGVTATAHRVEVK